MLRECDAVSVIQIIKILFYHARLEHRLLKCFMSVKTCMSTINKNSLYGMSEGVQKHVVNEAKHDNNFCTTHIFPLCVPCRAFHCLAHLIELAGVVVLHDGPGVCDDAAVVLNAIALVGTHTNRFSFLVYRTHDLIVLAFSILMQNIR